MHVTIVDDSLDNLNTYDDMLSPSFTLGLIQNPLLLSDFLKKNKTDLVLLDLHMPSMDGFELYKKIRTTHKNLPVIFLTGDSSEEHIIKGLDLGADDFVIKPFSLPELVARIKNKITLKRADGPASGSEVIHFEGFKLFCDTQMAEISNQKIQLTPIEFKFIHLLAKNPNKIYSREHMTNFIWPNTQVQNQNIDTHLSNLRKKLMPFSRFIKTIKSRGYILRVG